MMDRSRSKSPITRHRAYITQAETSTIGDLTPLTNIKADDEINEVSSTLTLVRKLHDQTSNDNNKKRLQIERLRKEVEQAKLISNSTNAEHKSLTSRIEQLQLSLSRAKAKYEEELSNKKVYLHVLDRMKQDKIQTERRANSLKRNLKSATMVLSSETERLRKTREFNSQSKSQIRQLRQNILDEKKVKEQRIAQLEKTLKQRQEITSRREQRNQRQAEIVQAAAELDKNSQEYKNRETLLLSRFWYKMLCKKLDKEKRRAQVLENAFQQIKNATGFKEIHEIVERFLTREKTYNELTQSVTTAEEKLNKLKLDNQRARDQLVQLQISSDSHSNLEFQTEINKLEEEIHQENKALARDEERYAKMSDIHDRASEWTNRILKKLGIEETAPTSLQITSTENTLGDCLNLLADKLEEMFGEIQEKDGEVDLRELWEIPAVFQSEISPALLEKNKRFTEREPVEAIRNYMGFETNEALLEDSRHESAEQDDMTNKKTESFLK